MRSYTLLYAVMRSYALLCALMRYYALLCIIAFLGVVARVFFCFLGRDCVQLRI